MKVKRAETVKEIRFSPWMEMGKQETRQEEEGAIRKRPWRMG